MLDALVSLGLGLEKWVIVSVFKSFFYYFQPSQLGQPSPVTLSPLSLCMFHFFFLLLAVTLIDNFTTRWCQERGSNMGLNLQINKDETPFVETAWFVDIISSFFIIKRSSCYWLQLLVNCVRRHNQLSILAPSHKCGKCGKSAKLEFCLWNLE